MLHIHCKFTYKKLKNPGLLKYLLSFAVTPYKTETWNPFPEFLIFIKWSTVVLHTFLFL